MTCSWERSLDLGVDGWHGVDGWVGGGGWMDGWMYSGNVFLLLQGERGRQEQSGAGKKGGARLVIGRVFGGEIDETFLFQGGLWMVKRRRLTKVTWL